ASTARSCTGGLGCRLLADAMLGKAYGDAGAFARLGLAPHTPAVQLDQALDDGEPEPRTTVLGALAAALEPLEHALLLVLGYADAPVLARECHTAALAHTGSE